MGFLQQKVFLLNKCKHSFFLTKGGEENVYKKRVRGESLSLDPSMRSSMRNESFYLKFKPEPHAGVSPRTASLWCLHFPTPTPAPAQNMLPSGP